MIFIVNNEILIIGELLVSKLTEKRVISTLLWMVTIINKVASQIITCQNLVVKIKCQSKSMTNLTQLTNKPSKSFVYVHVIVSLEGTLSCHAVQPYEGPVWCRRLSVLPFLSKVCPLDSYFQSKFQSVCCNKTYLVLNTYRSPGPASMADIHSSYGALTKSSSLSTAAAAALDDALVFFLP